MDQGSGEFLRSRGLFLETKIVAKCGLRALGSTFEPSWGSWRVLEKIQDSFHPRGVLDLGSTGTESACSLHRVLACLCACLLVCALTHSLCYLLPCLLVSVSVSFERLCASSLVDMLVCVLACEIAHPLALLLASRFACERAKDFY